MVMDSAGLLADMVTTAEAATLLDVVPQRVRQLVTTGQLAGVKRGHTWLFTRAAVEAVRPTLRRRGERGTDRTPRKKRPKKTPSPLTN